MTNVINILDEIQKRKSSEVHNPIVQALDALALALTDHNHNWSDREVSLYETAISYCGCKDSGSSA